MIFPDGVYDKLKVIAFILAPLITFLAALGDIWGIPHMVEICATLAALDTFLGALLTVSNRKYNEVNDVADRD